jgi:hypothetical protein
MSEQSRSSLAAIQERQAALGRQHTAAAEADRVLTDALASAHVVIREGVSRLDAIAAEIDQAVQNQALLAVDTPMGACEFQKYLVAKQHQVAAVVASARELDRTKKAVLQSLRAQYAVSQS